MVGIILAVGNEAPMKSKLPKVLHKICGKPITRYIIDACKECGISDCTIVTGNEANTIRTGLGDDAQYIKQPEQKGTGDACKRALDLLDERPIDVLVIPGNTPLVNANILSHLSTVHSSSRAEATVLTTILENPASYDRIERHEDGCLHSIIKARNASAEHLRIKEVNTGIYCFKQPVLREYIKKIEAANPQGEYDVTDIIGLIVSSGKPVNTATYDDSTMMLEINNRVDLAYAAEILRKQILNELMLSGITLIDPSSTYIDYDVQVGADTVIHPQTILENGTKIGERCTIGPSSRLVNVETGNEVTIIFSHVIESYIGDGTRIGPYANIRPGCKIGKNTKIGNFVEVKNSAIGDSVSAGHLSYLGDTSIGESTNIGAGTITCNYDGYTKHHTEIGKAAFIGSNSTIVAPLTVGDGAFIAAGSTITKDVPSDSLVVARSKQIVKEGWAKRRRASKDSTK